MGNKTCLAVEKEDMSSCSTRRNVFLLLKKKTCLLSIQKASRRHPGGTLEARDNLKAKCVFSYAFVVFVCGKNDATERFHVFWSDPTITVYHACAK